MSVPAEGITDSKYDVIGYYSKFLEYRDSLIAYNTSLTTLLATSNSKYNKAKNYMRKYNSISYLFYTAIESAKTIANDTAIIQYLTAAEQLSIIPTIREKYYNYYSSMYSKAKNLAATFVIAIADTQSTIDKVTEKLGDTDVLNYLEELGINVNDIPEYTVELPDIDVLETQTISKIATLNGLTVAKVVNSTKTAYTGVYNDFMTALDSMNFDTKTM
jgi:hypothetical protein